MDPAAIPEIASRKALGGEVLAVDEADGSCRIAFRPPATMANPLGILQGGFAFAMLDDAIGLAGWFGGGRRPFTTAQASVNYLRPVPMGEKLVAEARLVHRGRSQIVGEAELRRDGDERILARASTLLVFVEPR